MSEEGKAKERRKASKPIMEKRRRARINESLNELKALILEAMKKDNSCYSKLEKADILELTVQHLKDLKSQQVIGISSSNPASLANYRAGFNQCASEIARVVTGLGNTDPTLKTRLLEHLATRCLVTKPMDAADTRGQLPQSLLQNQPILSKPPTSSSKPLMEKRRRARINQSLNELKNLILEAMKKDTSCYSKLEKADILEMTVRYLRSMRNQNMPGRVNTSDPNTMARYRAGYNECVNEVTRYLMSLDGLDAQVRARLLSHLATFCTPCTPIIKPAESATEKLQQMQQPQAITVPMASPLGTTSFALPTPSLTKHSEINPSVLNTTQFQIVPGQLSNGKIAAVLVPSQNAPVTMVSSPQLIPVFNKAAGNFQSFQGYPGVQALRSDNDPLWRPW